MLNTGAVDLFSPKLAQESPTGNLFLQTNRLFLDVLLKDTFGFTLPRNKTTDVLTGKGNDK